MTPESATAQSAIRLEMHEGGIAVLRFTQPAAVLDQSTLDELESLLAEIETDPRIGGIVLTGGTPGRFVENAGLTVFEQAHADLIPLGEYLTAGQRICNQLGGMTVRTVAAFDGPCTAEAYEIALACDYRVATPNPGHSIGLPQIKYGVLPAWGGSARLSRLLGVPRALDLILSGATVTPRHAVALGLVDELAPREWLLRAAIHALRRDAVRKGRLTPLRNPLVNGVVGAWMAFKARRDALRRTRGHYPAIHQALRIVVRTGWARNLYVPLALERIAVRDLAPGDACRNLLRIHQRRGAESVSAAVPPAVQRVAVIGTGESGAGIAYWLSAHGIRTVLYDPDVARLGEGMARLFKRSDEAIDRWELSPREARDGIDRVSPIATAPPLGRMEWVIDSTDEPGIDPAAFQQVVAAASPNAIIAINSAAEPICRFSWRGEPAVGLHFFNPVHRKELVEVVLPENAEAERNSRVIDFVRQIGKVPVIVRDTPGFLAHRMLMPYLLEAVNAFNSGATPGSIDESMLDFGFAVGPLRLIEEMGVDTVVKIANSLAAAFPERLTVPRILTEMAAAGQLGRKSGKGFYLEASDKPNPLALELRRREPGVPTPSPGAVEERMVFRMLDEAVRCLAEGVVELPETVDLAGVLGAGFPPFRGGPLRYIDALGASRLVKAMGAHRLAPCERLAAMARDGRHFYGEEYRW